MAKICFECGKEARHRHHVVPASLGGKQTLPLCESCHSKVHGTNLSQSELIKKGLEDARARGVKIGGARKHDWDLIVSLWNGGLSYHEISTKLSIPWDTVRKIIRKHK